MLSLVMSRNFQTQHLSFLGDISISATRSPAPRTCAGRVRPVQRIIASDGHKSTSLQQLALAELRCRWVSGRARGLLVHEYLQRRPFACDDFDKKRGTQMKLAALNKTYIDMVPGSASPEISRLQAWAHSSIMPQAYLSSRCQRTFQGAIRQGHGRTHFLSLNSPFSPSLFVGFPSGFL